MIIYRFIYIYILLYIYTLFESCIKYITYKSMPYIPLYMIIYRCMYIYVCIYIYLLPQTITMKISMKNSGHNFSNEPLLWHDGCCLLLRIISFSQFSFHCLGGVSSVTANERRPYICNIASHWLRSYQDVERNGHSWSLYLTPCLTDMTWRGRKLLTNGSPVFI